MNIFKESTQFKNWILKSQKDIDTAQIQKYERGLKILASLNNDLQTHQTQDSKDKQQVPQKIGVNLKKVLSNVEEKEYIIHYTHQILILISKKIPSRSLKTCAMSFFRRFYFKKAVFDYDPDYILCATLFLGLKIAQISVNVDLMKTICPFLKEINKVKNVENILLLFEYEFYLINVLNYDFYVFCPYKAMVGFLYNLKQNQGEENLIIFPENSNLEKDFELKCESLIDNTFLTDLIFLYSYSYIALSCIFLTAEFYNIESNTIRALLKLDLYLNFDNFFTNILPTVKEYLGSIKILSEDEFMEKKTKLYKFLKRNPKYVEKIEKDRE